MNFDETPMELDEGNSLIRSTRVVVRCLEGMTHTHRIFDYNFSRKFGKL